MSTGNLINSQLFFLNHKIDQIEFLKYVESYIDNCGKTKLEQMLSKMIRPLTIVLEEDYVDKAFRDSYYN